MASDAYELLLIEPVQGKVSDKGACLNFRGESYEA